MFARGRYPAAFAVTVAVGFPALAAAAVGSDPRVHAGQGLRVSPAVEGSRGQRAPRGPGLLDRPHERLRETIEVQVREIRERQRRLRRQTFAELPAGVPQATLDAIGSCESGGDPTAVSSDGSYRGKYQFGAGTWASVGGSGDAATASESEQDYRAALLYSQAGSSPWPNCAA